MDPNLVQAILPLGGGHLKSGAVLAIADQLIVVQARRERRDRIRNWNA